MSATIWTSRGSSLAVHQAGHSSIFTTQNVSSQRRFNKPSHHALNFQRLTVHPTTTQCVRNGPE